MQPLRERLDCRALPVRDEPHDLDAASMAVAVLASSEGRHVHVDVDDDGRADVGQVDEIHGEVDGQAAEGKDRREGVLDTLPGFGGRSLR